MKHLSFLSAMLLAVTPGCAFAQPSSTEKPNQPPTIPTIVEPLFLQPNTVTGSAANFKLPVIPRYGNFSRENDNLTFPADTILNVKTEFGAKGDGVSDDTAAIQKALVASTGQKERKIVYLPNGTYLISDTLRWAGRETRTILQGQSESKVIIKLRDRCSGFGDPTKPKAMVWTGDFPPQRFRNAIRNLTFDTGNRNAGAIGAQFNASNQGILREVTLQSGDGSGAIGLDMAYTGDVGPLMVKNLTVRGFDVGIYTSHGSAGQWFEGVTLENQNVAGLVNDGQAIALRALSFKGSVPAIINKPVWGHIALLDSRLEGTGAASGVPAILNNSVMLARNVLTSGFQTAIRGEQGYGLSMAGPYVAEYTSEPVRALFPSPARTLNLPVQETPEVAWEDPKTWKSVADYQPVRTTYDDVLGFKRNVKTLAEATADLKPTKETVMDWTGAVQQALDSGASTIYFPPGKDYVLLGDIKIPPTVRRIIGAESAFANLYRGRVKGGGRWFIEGGTAPLTIERFEWMYAPPILYVNTTRPVTISSCAGGKILGGPGSNIFIEDYCGTFRTNRGNMWARQFNPEYTDEAQNFIGEDTNWAPPSPGAPPESRGNWNQGGNVWVLGVKTEGSAPVFSTTDGGKTEVLGGLIYSNVGNYANKKMFIVNSGGSATFSLREQTNRRQPFNMLHETRGDVTKTIGAKGTDGAVVALVVAAAGAPTPEWKAPAQTAQGAAAGTGLTAQYFSDPDFRTLKSTRLEPTIDFDWTSAGPDGLGKTGWSARFFGQLEAPVTGTYAFNLGAENSRVLVGDFTNDALYRWVRFRNGSTVLEAGKKYPVIFEYRGVKAQKVALTWQMQGARPEPIPTNRLYPLASELPTVSIAPAKRDLIEGETTNIVLTRAGDASKPLTVPLEPRVDWKGGFAIDFGGRGSAIAGDDYTPLPDSFTFAAGQKEVSVPFKTLDNKRLDPSRFAQFDLAFSPNFLMSGGGARITIADNDMPPAGTGTGLKGEYFQGKDFTDPKGTRIDPVLNWGYDDWNKKAPIDGIDASKGYSVRWTGELLPQFSEEYAFGITTTPYGRTVVTIDGKELINAKGKDAVLEGRIKLEAGKKVPIRIDFTNESSYGAIFSLSWSSASQFGQIVPKSQLFPAP